MFEPPTQTGVDDVHAHPRHVGHRWLDLLLALTALFISGVSLYVAVEHGHIEQRLVEENAQLVQANSWPFLQIDGEYATTQPTTVSLVNAGIGPAKLELFQVRYRGKSEPDILALLKDCCGLPADPAARKEMAPKGILTASTADGVLRPGEKLTFIRVDTTSDQHTLENAFRQAYHDIEYRACFCSVFDACWIGNLKGLKLKPVAACPTGERSFNDQVDFGAP